MTLFHPMSKDGETILVHPTCVPAHREAGWSLSGDPVEETTPRRKARAAATENTETGGTGPATTEAGGPGQA